MDAWRYEISLLVLKKYFHLLTQTNRQKFRLSKLTLYHRFNIVSNDNIICRYNFRLSTFKTEGQQKNFVFYGSIRDLGGGARGYFLDRCVAPGTPNWHPVLKKNSPKTDTRFQKWAGFLYSILQGATRVQQFAW